MDKNLKPIVGVSACLLGEQVRYDGGHKLQPQLQSYLQPFLDLVPVCPEVSAGLGVPRPTIQLRQQTESIRAIINQQEGSEIDVSDRLTKVAVQFLNEYKTAPLCGFVFKSRSPSCGLGSTPVENGENYFTNGLFADRIQGRERSLVMVEESWLVNAARHYRFLSACYLYFHRFHGGPIEPDLLSALDLEPAPVRERDLIEDHINNLLSENDKAAVDQRLCNYWASR